MITLAETATYVTMSLTHSLNLIRVMRKHDPTNKKTKTITNTFREYLQRATFETFETFRVMIKHDLTNKNTTTKTTTLREHLQRTILEKLRNC